VLKLEVYGSESAMDEVSVALDAVPGVRHVALSPTGRGGSSRVSADLPTEAADATLKILADLRVPEEDVVLVDLDRVGTTTDPDEPLVIVWADILAQARERAHVPGRYVVLMAAAGVVATFALIDRSAVLIVGAMAISPDLLPITAACTGLVLLQAGLAARGILALAAGLAVTGAVAGGLTVLLDVMSLLPDGYKVGTIPAGQSHVGPRPSASPSQQVSPGCSQSRCTEVRRSASRSR
jgi:hypothetical protein